MSLLSRVAERIYWTSRYLERAETTSRLARVYGNLLLDLPREAGLVVGRAGARSRAAPSAIASCTRIPASTRPSGSSSPTARTRARCARRWRSRARACARRATSCRRKRGARSTSSALWVTQELDAETSHRRRYGIHSRVVEALPADQRLARRHDEPRRRVSVLPLRPRHRARRHDHAHHRRRRRDAARPRGARALRQLAVDGRAAVAVGVSDVSAEGAPAHLWPRRHRLSIEGRAVSARDRVQPARDRRRARDAAAQRRADQEARRAAAHARAARLERARRSRTCTNGSTTRSSSSASCTGSCEATWFRPSTSAPGQTPTARRSRNLSRKPSLRRKDSRRGNLRQRRFRHSAASS